MPKPKRKRATRFLLVGTMVVVAATAATVVVWKRREPVITVQTERVQRRNLTEKVVANGRIQPVLQVKISPEVSGEIIELPVKEGQLVEKGDLLLKIKPDYYKAATRSAEAGYQSAVSNRNLAAANLRKAQVDFKRVEELFADKLVSESNYTDAKAALDVAEANWESSKHQIDVAKASLDRAEEDLAKTTIYSPLTGTISKLNSQLGERVVGTAMMTGTEVLTISDLNEMEARVDIGEVDVVLIKAGQVAGLEVDAFRDRKFKGVVTEIANSSKTAMTSGTGQEATKFEVKIRISEKEVFRPGMSVTAEVETRYRTNVLSVPIQSVTTRIPKEKKSPQTTWSNGTVLADSGPAENKGHSGERSKKGSEAAKPIEAVFAARGDRAVLVPVKRGISDDTYMEITDGLEEGDEVVSGAYKAISRDLEDGKKIKREQPKRDAPTEIAKDKT